MQEYQFIFYNVAFFVDGKPTKKSILGGGKFLSDCPEDAADFVRQEKIKIRRFYTKKFGSGLFDKGIYTELSRIN
jgi:hypothetical protein